MARPKKTVEEEAKEVVAEMVTKPEECDINDMPLKTLGDHMRYNARARAMNKKLKICRYPIKPCPVELHPTDTIVFGRNDQPDNVLPVYLSNDMIEFKMKLYPGKTYDLPRCVIDYLATKGTPIWKWFNNADGSKETRVAHSSPRFAIRTVYKG